MNFNVTLMMTRWYCSMQQFMSPARFLFDKQSSCQNKIRSKSNWSSDEFRFMITIHMSILDRLRTLFMLIIMTMNRQESSIDFGKCFGNEFQDYRMSIMKWNFCFVVVVIHMTLIKNIIETSKWVWSMDWKFSLQACVNNDFFSWILSLISNRMKVNVSLMEYHSTSLVTGSLYPWLHLDIDQLIIT